METTVCRYCGEAIQLEYHPRESAKWHHVKSGFMRCATKAEPAATVKEAEERTRIGNTPSCDECGEQHSQDTSCEEYAEAQSWNRVTTEGEMLRESAKRVGFTG